MGKSREATLVSIKKSIKTIFDYPKPGIHFRDITSLLIEPVILEKTIQIIVEHYRNAGITKIAGVEARGFVFATPLALALGVGLVLIRKPGKLPRETKSIQYGLEYGNDQLEIHTDAINSSDKVLIVDDLLATGGTIEATVELIRSLGGEVNDATFVIELSELTGREKMKALGVKTFSVVSFTEDEQ